MVNDLSSAIKYSKLMLVKLRKYIAQPLIPKLHIRIQRFTASRSDVQYVPSTISRIS